MNTGGQLPYQLRPNKAVERLVFFELLRRFDPVLQLGSGYAYIGFGGPQMEDFRMLHDLFRDMKMLSIEREEDVLRRQRFNGPHTNVRCKLQTSGEFVLTVSNTRKLIVWLDYTEASERLTQIAELQALLRNSRGRNIIKVTLNASSATLGGVPGQKALVAIRHKNFLSDFGRFFPTGLDEEAVVEGNFPNALLSVLDYASKEALAGRPGWHFQLLNSTVYADSKQQMLTATGIVGESTDITGILTVSKTVDWEFSRLSWNDAPLRIRVPELTMKERIFINQLLPRLANDAPAIQRRLGFRLDSDEDESREKLRNYISFQRHYPFWGKVTV